MGYFKDAQEVYDHIGRLFREVADDDELASMLERRANTIVQYRYNRPEAVVTVKTVDGEDVQVDCGETDLQPDVVLTMSADTGHRLWLGDVNVAVAIARGEIRAQGPAGKVLDLVPLVKPLLPRYRAIVDALHPAQPRVRRAP